MRTRDVPNSAYSSSFNASAETILSLPGWAVAISARAGRQRSSRSTATTRAAPSDNKARVRPPGPGPTSYRCAFERSGGARDTPREIEVEEKILPERFLRPQVIGRDDFAKCGQSVSA